MYRGLLIVALLFACMHTSHQKLLVMPGIDGLAMGLGPRAKRLTKGPRNKVVADVLPSSDALQWLSLGYKNLVADYYWLRCINDYGDKRMVAGHYPNLLPLLTRVQALDPNFVAPYIFAGNVLTLSDMPWHEALKMLEVGMHQRPDSWRIALSYGFNMYFLGESLDKAARALALAAANPEAPPYAGPLAVRLAAQAGEPEVGLTLLDALLSETQDASQKQALRERRQKLLLEVHLKHLNAAAQVYRRRHGQGPPDLQALVGLADVHHIAADPFGGDFFIDAQGEVQSHHTQMRLRLNDPNKELSPARH
jgi:hypothetical protein